MNRQEILERAISKAIEGGWKDSYIDSQDLKNILDNDPFILPIKGLIFNHDFAQALWGEQEIEAEDTYMHAWAYHLRQMVVADDPIEYLGKNI